VKLLKFCAIAQAARLPNTVEEKIAIVIRVLARGNSLQMIAINKPKETAKVNIIPSLVPNDDVFSSASRPNEQISSIDKSSSNLKQ
jgi:hypothetical protein